MALALTWGVRADASALVLTQNRFMSSRACWSICSGVRLVASLRRFKAWEYVSRVFRFSNHSNQISTGSCCYLVEIGRAHV